MKRSAGLIGFWRACLPWAGGATIGATVAAILTAIALVRVMVTPRDPLPRGVTHGYLIFSEYPVVEETPPSLRRLALDMSRGGIRPVPEGVALMSPDGRWVVFRDGRCRGPRGELTEVPRDTLLPAPPGSAPPRRASLAANGTLVCVEKPSLIVANLATGVRVALQQPLHFSFSHLALSPTGDAAYIQMRQGAGRPSIYRVDLTNNQRRVVGPGCYPAVSASGTLAYITPSLRSIMVVQPDGRPREVPGPGVWLSDLCWSPDERFIAYLYPVRADTMLWKTQRYMMGVGLLEVSTGRHIRTVLLRDGCGTLDLVDALSYPPISWVSSLPAVGDGQ